MALNLIGSQTPTFEWCPPAPTTAGDEAIEVASRAGIVYDPWQQRMLRGTMGETFTGQWVCNEVCLIVGRQNGKGGVLEGRELYGIFVAEENRILHSAHQQRTATDMFTRMKRFVESTPEYDARLFKIVQGKGSEGMIFRHKGQGTGSWRKETELLYVPRTGSAGRGLTKANTVILDEAMILDSPPIAALLPTMATIPNWQVWYVASQGDRKLPTESRVLGGVRRRGFQRDKTLFFAEWAAHLKHNSSCPRNEQGIPTDRLDIRADPQTWAKTNPAMGIRITEGFLRKMIVGGGMPAWDADREFLGVGDYPEDDGWSIFSPEVWASLHDGHSTFASGYCVGIDVAHDQSTTSISIIGKRSDGLWHVEWVKTEAGTAWAVNYCKRMMGLAKRPVVFVTDKRCPIANDVKDAVGERRYYAPTSIEWASWCSKIVQLVTETYELRHRNQYALTDAAKHVRKKEYADGSFVFVREDPSGDITPWLALTLALGGALVKGTKRGGRAMVAAG
jgi:hypothetical protein